MIGTICVCIGGLVIAVIAGALVAPVTTRPDPQGFRKPW
jgi:hypothetical protein